MLYFDYTIIGGGIFGCYAAHYLAQKGAKVAVLEKESSLFRKASLVNQARLHGGYHYPRSIATAALSDEHKTRFTEEHGDFINGSFEKYYAIDKYGSFTDPAQFERFCEYLHIKCETVEEHPYFNFDRLESLYLTEEHSFDPVLLRQYYTQLLDQHEGITVFKNAKLEEVRLSEDWKIRFSQNQYTFEIETPTVINATYAATNSINRLFGLQDIDLTHEISEIAFVISPQMEGKGLTVMDGPFGSIMPYGKSGLLSLSSVAYTHHKISYDNLPRFDCQTDDTPHCTPERPGICTTCVNRPLSNANKMLAQMKCYFSDRVEFQYMFSYFTIKSKMKASHIDDGRPTEISILKENPRFICLFSGKINSIYEIEKIL